MLMLQPGQPLYAFGQRAGFHAVTMFGRIFFFYPSLSLFLWLMVEIRPSSHAPTTPNFPSSSNNEIDGDYV
jgi:hypothetical protein